jgi:hypothetical protein
MIVAFTGKMGSGKDTAADGVFCDFRWAFAAPLKDGVKTLFDFTKEQMTDPIQKDTIDQRWGISPREMLQYIGTDCIRAKIPGFFVTNMRLKFEQLETHKAFPLTALVTDVRFDDEAALIRKHRGIVIKIHRPSLSDDRSAHTAHASEAGLSPGMIDHIVVNDGSVEELHAKVMEIVERHNDRLLFV